MERFEKERFQLLRHLFRGPVDLTRHHHDSYNRLLETQIPYLLKEISPIKIPLVQKDRAELLQRGANPEIGDDGSDGESDSEGEGGHAGAAAAAASSGEATATSLTEEDTKDIEIYRGFDAVVTIHLIRDDGTGVHIRKPVIYDENEKGEKIPQPMYPNDARLRHMSYMAPITVDIEMRILNLREKTFKVSTLNDVPLIDIPLLVHSKACWLHEMSRTALTEAGEDPDDPGGYFIINGAERLLVSQERVIPNMAYVTNKPDIMMACSVPNSTRVRVLRMEFDTKTKGIVVSVPGVKGMIPLTVLFRALGVISDLDIARHIFGKPLPDIQEGEIIQDTFASGHGIYDQHSAMRFLAHVSRGLTMMSSRTIIHQHLFPQQTGGLPEKIALLGQLARQLIHRKLGRVNDTDRDNFRNKKLAITGSLLAELLSEILSRREEEIRKKVSSEYNYNNQTYRDDKVFHLLSTIQTRKDSVFGAQDNTALILRSMKGQWGADPERGISAQVEGVSQAMDRLTYLSALSHLRRVALERVPDGKALGARRQHMSSFGYICPSETPSGGPKIGIVKNLAVLTRISAGVSSHGLHELLEKAGLLKVKMVRAAIRRQMYSVYVDGVLAGYTPDGLGMHQILLGMRRKGQIHPTVSLAFLRIPRFIWISTGSGRLMRPLIRVNGGRPMIKEALKQFRDAKDPEDVYSVTPFTREVAVRSSSASVDGETAIELIDPWEMETLYVAQTPLDVTPEHTHVEIHPSSIFGVMGVLIPYAPHNQGPRNLYSCAQSKQATSVYSKAFRSRYDHAAMILTSPQRPLANTWWGRRMGDSALAYGTNLIVAIACFSGYNQEDGVLLNKTSLERGLFRVIKTGEMSQSEEYSRKSKTRVRIVDPRTIQGVTECKKLADYSALLEDGTVPEGTKIYPGLVLFGKISEADGDFPRDVSVVAGRFAKGIVESKVILRLPGGHRLVKYRISTFRSPELGDKFSSRAGQKGTCGMLIPEYDMPRTPDGIVPDLIVNPHAIPSRMTIGQIQEVVVSKLGAILGTEIDATAFTQNGVFGDNIANLLLANGYDDRGDEVMYSGVTGELLHSKIFIGPTYYMRLKHMSADKINYRGGGLVDRGPVDARTRQPIGGRAREGGLRIGEMERDSVISHGVSRFLQESLTVRADGEHSLVCAESGKQAFHGDGKTAYPGLRSVERDGPFRYRGSTPDTIENTTHTTSVTRYSEIPMPRGLRVLTQEMEAMGIDTRIFTDGGAPRLRSSMIGGKPILPAVPEAPITKEEPVPVISDEAQVQVGTSRWTNVDLNPEPSGMSLTDALEKYVNQQAAARKHLSRTFIDQAAKGRMGTNVAIAAQEEKGKQLTNELKLTLEPSLDKISAEMNDTKTPESQNGASMASPNHKTLVLVNKSDD